MRPLEFNHHETEVAHVCALWNLTITKTPMAHTWDDITVCVITGEDSRVQIESEWRARKRGAAQRIRVKWP